jgi:hypothetical protein
VLVIDTSPADFFAFGTYPIARFQPLAQWVGAHCEPPTTVGGAAIHRCR